MKMIVINVKRDGKVMQFLRISMRKKVEQQVVAKIGCFRRSADERETGQIVSVITEAFNYGVPLLFFLPRQPTIYQSTVRGEEKCNIHQRPCNLKNVI